MRTIFVSKSKRSTRSSGIDLSPLIQINPSYRRTTTINGLTASGALNPRCAEIFRTSPTADAPTFLPISRAVPLTAGVTTTTANFNLLPIGGRGVVILGTCSVATSGVAYEAIVLTSGGVVEIVSSNGVSWAFTEQR